MLIISTNDKNHSLAARETAAGELVFVEKDDTAAIRRLQTEAEQYTFTNEAGRLECYLLLSEPTSLWMLQTIGLPNDIATKVDVFATTMEDLLAKTVFVKLPNLPTRFPSLDRQPILASSLATVHLVVVGFSAQAEALALNAALVAHYPNYCKNTRLRTRITIVDDRVFDGRDRMTQRYAHLFDHSYYRSLDLNDPEPACVLHRPVYEQTRKDCVDVEWEFVNGNIRNAAIRQKLEEWSTDSRQQLTIAICHADQRRNFNESLELPSAIYSNNIPVLSYTEDNNMLQIAQSDGAFLSVIPFAPSCCDIGTLRVLKQLALRVNYVYDHCFQLKPDDPPAAPAVIDESKLEEKWRAVGPLPKQYSNIFNAMTLGTKMHSIGHDETEWEAYYALTVEEIELLQEVEHNRWNVEQLLLGYRPVTDEEQQAIEADISLKRTLRNTKKAHYDIRAYDDLRADSTGKNVNVYDMVLTQGIPLIIKSCITD